jgi:hypothetical protein
MAGIVGKGNAVRGRAYSDRITDARVSVRALSGERTFWEKATILHAEANWPSDKKRAARRSRHYADLAMLADHEIGKRALVDLQLLARVVEHKKVFFPDPKANYDAATPGTFRLIPDGALLNDLASDYRDMREMFFDTPPSWNEIVERLRVLEESINRTK